MGQNFLVDPNLARKLVDALEVEPGGRVVEIGPGTGVLTARLLDRGARVDAVEKDLRLADLLRRKFQGEERFRLHVGDALSLDPDFGEGPGPSRLISNLPYSVTSPLLLRIVFWGLPLERIVVTVQKEVARRLVAREGRTYGRLSVLLGLFGATKLLFDLPPSAFRPRPRVTSSAILIVPDRSRPPLRGGSAVEAVVKTAFSERRKQMAKLLAAGWGRERSDIERLLAECGISPSARAEEVSPEQFAELARRLKG